MQLYIAVLSGVLGKKDFSQWNHKGNASASENAPSLLCPQMGKDAQIAGVTLGKATVPKDNGLPLSSIARQQHEQTAPFAPDP